LSLPRYDLALLAPRLLGAGVQEVVAAPEHGLPDHQQVADERDQQERLLWAVLVGAIVVLGGVLVRLLRMPGSS
jgi:hypothetical protein